MVYCSTSCRINAHRMKERLLKKLNYSEQNRPSCPWVHFLTCLSSFGSSRLYSHSIRPVFLFFKRCKPEPVILCLTLTSIGSANVFSFRRLYFVYPSFVFLGMFGNVSYHSFAVFTHFYFSIKTRFTTFSHIIHY